MTCSDRFADADDYKKLLCSDVDITDADTVDLINTYLDMAAGDIHAALASVGACDCTLADWATNYLKKLNVIDAAVIQQCPCGQMKDNMRPVWINWLNEQYELIRSGEIALCQGETGASYPAFAIAERPLTEWSEADIIWHREQRRS